MLAIGAKAAGHWQGAHMTPIDSAAPPVETPLLEGGKGNSMNRYDYPYGITVNSLGLRFYDEGEAKHSYTYAKTGRAVLAQPGGAAFQIYDQTGVELFRRGPNYKATMFEAPSIAELAQKIGIEPAVLVHTVEEFNAACRSDVPLDPRVLDGKCTIGISPPKSNWAEPIQRAPFRAYPITAGVTFTFGGLQVDTKAQVINTGHRPITGSSLPATWSACSSTIIPPAPARRATSCSVIWPAAMPPPCRTDRAYDVAPDYLDRKTEHGRAPRRLGPIHSCLGHPAPGN